MKVIGALLIVVCIAVLGCGIYGWVNYLNNVDDMGKELTDLAIDLLKEFDEIDDFETVCLYYRLVLTIVGVVGIAGGAVLVKLGKK